MRNDGFLKILFIGDIVGSAGCKYVSRQLNNIRYENDIQLVIANGENSADGNGITPFSADLLFRSGVDVITTGNHCFRRREIFDYFNSDRPLIRPLNLGTAAPGVGFVKVDLGFCEIGVVNLMGRAFMTPIDNPFSEMENFLKSNNLNNIVVDFHAEASSEKKAMGFFLEEKVSAVIGTHTHVQTADETILKNHTAYITDVGMCGSKDSVLGIKPDIIIDSYTEYVFKRHEVLADNIQLDGVIITLDYKSGKSVDIKRIQHSL